MDAEVTLPGFGYDFLFDERGERGVEELADIPSGIESSAGHVSSDSVDLFDYGGSESEALSESILTAVSSDADLRAPRGTAATSTTRRKTDRAAPWHAGIEGELSDSNSQSSNSNLPRFRNQKRNLQNEDWPPELTTMPCKALNEYLRKHPISAEELADLRIVRRRLQTKRAAAKKRMADRKKRMFGNVPTESSELDIVKAENKRLTETVLKLTEFIRMNIDPKWRLR